MKIHFCTAAIISALVLVKCDHRTESQFEECRKKMGVTEESFKLPKDPEDPNTWCVNACAMEKKGVMMNGKAVTEKVIEDISQDMPEKAKEAIRANAPVCVEEANKENNECAVFMVLRNCLIDKSLFRKNGFSRLDFLKPDNNTMCNAFCASPRESLCD